MNKNKEWEKELSDLYQVLFGASDTCGCEFCRDHNIYITVEDMKKIREFISQAIISAEERARKEVIKAITYNLTLPKTIKNGR